MPAPDDAAPTPASDVPTPGAPAVAPTAATPVAAGPTAALRTSPPAASTGTGAGTGSATGPTAPLPLGPRARLTARRVVQFALDLGITALLCCIPLSVLLVLPRNPDGTLGSLLISVPILMVAMAACVVISWWYWALLPSRRGGRTTAMGWLGLRVVGVDGSAARSPQLAIRWLMLIVDGLFGGLVAVAAMLTSQRGQRIGDVFASTLVVHVPKAPLATAPAASDPGPPGDDPTA